MAILTKLAGRNPLASLTPNALSALCAYRFPGNVRELENILERALAFASQGIINVSDLALTPSPSALPSHRENAGQPLTPAASIKQAKAYPFEIYTPDLSNGLSIPLPEYLDAIEREIIRNALSQTKNNRTLAAQLLGISFRQLRYQIHRLGIQDTDS